MDASGFEKDRLAFFHHCGFDGESRWLEGPDGRKTYGVARTKGGRSPTAVLVHGGLAEATVWAPMAAKLPGSVLVLDRPGHGLSDAIDYTGMDYRRAAVDWMRSVVDALGAEQVDLVGNSMGGYFCLVFALAHPDRVRRLALVGAPAGIDRELPLFLRLWGRPVVGNLISAMISTMKEPEVFRTRVMAPLVAHPERISEQALRIMMNAGTKPGWHPMVRSMLGAISDLGGWRRELLIREEVAALSVETLFLWGDADGFAPASSGEDVARRMPSARLEFLADAGHVPQLDTPEACAKSVTRFFAEGCAASASTPAA